VAGQFPAGHVADYEAITELIALLDGVSIAAHQSLYDFDQTDPVSYDLTVEVLEGVEKYRWMLRAQRQNRFAAWDSPPSQLSSPRTHHEELRSS
jgi:hypothetical protein